LAENVAGGAPKQGTRVTLCRTDTHLNLHYECVDTRPWATISERKGALYNEEVVEVFLDPFGDLECYFEIEVNPLNAVLDLMLRRVGKGWRKDWDWVCEGFESTASLTEIGWNATMSIPFAAMMPRPPAPGSVWRANFYRIDMPKGEPRELSAWSPTLRGTFHVSPRFGFLEF
jgi:hypothetical protein